MPTVDTVRFLITRHADDTLAIHRDIAPVLHAERGFNAGQNGSRIPLFIHGEGNLNRNKYEILERLRRRRLIAVS